MNETKATLTKNRFSWLSDVLNWVFTPSIHVHESEENVSKVIHGRLLGGIFRISAVIFMVPNLNGITVMIGVSHFHFDLDLFHIPRPEIEIQNDRVTNIKRYREKSVDFLTWFLGYEGIGIYRQKSLTNGYGVSKIIIGAHPMLSLGFANVYAAQTQHAVVGFQLMNLQMGVHSAWDNRDV